MFQVDFNFFFHFRITRTVRTFNQTVTSPGGQNNQDLNQSIQEIVDQFMADERKPQ